MKKYLIFVKNLAFTGTAKDTFIIFSGNILSVGRIDGFKDNNGWVAGCAANYLGVKKIVVE